MSHSFSCLHNHVIWSTRKRFPFIDEEIQGSLWECIGGIAKQEGAVPLQIGGVPDHVHVLLGMPPTICPSLLVRKLKSLSCAWVRSSFPSHKGFAWQDGYGIFSVSKQNVESVRRYIANQAQHHLSLSFESEMKDLLEKCEADCRRLARRNRLGPG